MLALSVRRCENDLAGDVGVASEGDVGAEGEFHANFNNLIGEGLLRPASSI
jgi:hypothetical protein